MSDFIITAVSFVVILAGIVLVLWAKSKCMKELSALIDSDLGEHVNGMEVSNTAVPASEMLVTAPAGIVFDAAQGAAQAVDTAVESIGGEEVVVEKPKRKPAAKKSTAVTKDANPAKKATKPATRKKPAADKRTAGTKKNATRKKTK